MSVHTHLHTHTHTEETNSATRTDSRGPQENMPASSCQLVPNGSGIADSQGRKANSGPAQLHQDDETCPGMVAADRQGERAYWKGKPSLSGTLGFCLEKSKGAGEVNWKFSTFRKGLP